MMQQRQDRMVDEKALEKIKEKVHCAFLNFEDVVADLRKGIVEAAKKSLGITIDDEEGW